MSCFSCINPRRKDVRKYDEDTAIQSAHSVRGKRKACGDGTGRGRGRGKGKTRKSKESNCIKGNAALCYTFRELASATQNFREANMIGQGGFGCVYKGRLDSGQIVAVKVLNLDGLQGKHEFLIEVLMLSTLHHPHLVTLMGYCNEGDQRLLVYEYMPGGSLANHLFDLDPVREPLDWSTRVKIAIGTARGLEYLHCKVDPPVIYRDLKSSNILLDNHFNPKLSDFGLAKFGPVGDKTHVSTRVMGTYGYCAPDYARSGKLTIKSDIYSFGVVLLELITGRRAIDYRKKPEEQNLINWSRPFLKDKKRFPQLVDPLLQGRFPIRSLQHAVAITIMCLQDQAQFRPLIGDIVVALEYLASLADISEAHKCGPSTPPQSSPSQRDSNLPSREKYKRVTFAIKE